MRGAFLFLDTNWTAEIKRAKIKSGKVVLADGEHILDKTTPFQLKSFFGTRPLYLMKWNSLYPMTFEVQEKTSTFKDVETGKEIQMTTKELVPVKTEFYEKGGAGYSPEILKTTQDVRFLKGMKKYAEGAPRDWKNIASWVLGIIIFLGAGFLIYQFMLGGGIKL